MEGYKTHREILNLKEMGFKAQKSLNPVKYRKNHIKMGASNPLGAPLWNHALTLCGMKGVKCLSQRHNYAFPSLKPN